MDAVRQEAIEKLELGDCVTMAPWEIDEWCSILGDYSSTLPSGTRIGKRWMRHHEFDPASDAAGRLGGESPRGKYEGWWSRSRLSWLTSTRLGAMSTLG